MKFRNYRTEHWSESEFDTINGEFIEKRLIWLRIQLISAREECKLPAKTPIKTKFAAN
jgi:hypothetical protein